MSDADFATIAAILHQESGIVLSDSKSSMVYSRLARRLRELGLASFRDYCGLVESDAGAGERMKMLAALTTNVTQFFRENHHFEHLRNHVLPPLVAEARRGGRLRIWSAGCSNGHEPYSIAMTLLSVMPDAGDHDVRILASDIDPNVVSFARAGFYDSAALEAVPVALRRRWFAPASSVAPDGTSTFEVAPELRRLVAFRELNLIGTWPMQGTFQAIFCRNVTIYFDAPTREAIWHRFCRHLDPGGIFYMGHSERMAGPAADYLRYCDTTAYQRTDEPLR